MDSDRDDSAPGQLTTIIDSYLDDSPTLDSTRDELLVRAERELVKVIEEVSPIDLVGRFDGENVKSREAHRRNFNEPYNPFLLLVSRVGEEGIDLQRHCRYVLHYDLEWNQRRWSSARAAWIVTSGTRRCKFFVRSSC